MNTERTTPTPDQERVTAAELPRPIPVEMPSLDGWKDIPVREAGERLAPVGTFSAGRHGRLLTDSLYFGERRNSPYPYGEIGGSLMGMYLRESVADQLLRAQELLPPHHYLVVWDAYRTLEVQQSLFDDYYGELAALHPDWDEAQLLAEAQKYVSIPSTDPDRPSPHNTGGSVDVDIVTLPPEYAAALDRCDRLIAEYADDFRKYPEVYELEMARLRIIDSCARPLDFGTKRDDGTAKAAATYYEQLALERPLTVAGAEAAANRRMLYNAMRLAGLEAYEHEWWHFNSPESQMGAKTAGRAVATYGAAELDSDARQYELLRRQHLAGSIVLYEQLSGVGTTKLGGRSGDLALVERVVKAGEHPRATVLPAAEAILPS